jgi:hypothetical protein
MMEEKHYSTKEKYFKDFLPASLEEWMIIMPISVKQSKEVFL